MIDVFESLLPIFLIISLGFILRKTALIKPELWQGMEILAYWVLFPALLADTLIHAQFANIPLLNFIIALITPIFIISIILITTQPILYKSDKIKAPEYTTIFQTSIRWNAFIALAIATRFNNDSGIALVAAAMAVLVPIVNVIVVSIFAIYNQNKKQKTTWKNIQNTIVITLKNPFIIASIIGVIINIVNVNIYEPILTTLNVIGKSALGIALLIVGAGLSANALKNASSAIWIGTINKLFILPTITIILCVGLNVTGETFKMAIICAAVPTAMNGYVLAKQMGGNAELYAATVTIQTLISVISIPLFLWLAQHILPNMM